MTEVKIRCLTVGMFQVNTYLVEDPDTGACAIIDTGEGEELAEALVRLDPRPDVRLILLTHGHADHAGGLVALQEAFPEAVTCLPRLEREMFELLPRQSSVFGLPAVFNRPCGRIDRYLDDGDVIELGEQQLRFFSTPGHTPGQGCYIASGAVFVGDTLFAGSVGRTDFPMSDPQLAERSLSRLMSLPGQLTVYPGHGPETTLQRELAANPFLAHVRRERGIDEPRGGVFGANWG